MCLQVTFQNKLPSYFNCNVSTCTENVEVSVTGKLLVYKWRALTKASHPYLVSLATETQLRETQSQTGGKGLQKKLYTCGGKPLLQGFYETLL